MAKTIKLASWNTLAPVEGRYAFRRELGRGAHGRVWLALDRSDGDAPRVVKVMPAERAARLSWEWEVLGRVQHPAVARALDLLRVQQPRPDLELPVGAVLMVTELRPGQSADRVARQLAGSVSECVSLTLRVGWWAARALAAFHRQGLVHGDVKPSNILVDAQQITLIDPELAGPPMWAAAIEGSPQFMAPELWRGERTFAADGFALGMTLLTLLDRSAAHGDGVDSGERDATSAEWLQRSITAATRVQRLGADVPAALRELITALLSPDAAERPDVREVAARLSSLASAHGVMLPESELDAAVADHDAGPSTAERITALSSLPWVGDGAVLAKLVSRLTTAGVTWVVGPRGSGRGRLVREAVQRVQAECVRAGARVPSCVVASELPVHAPGHDCVLHWTREPLAADAAALDAMNLVRAALVDGHRLHVVLERDISGAHAGDDDVVLAPLSRDQVRQLSERAWPGARISDGWIEEAMAVSGGLPSTLCRLLSEAVAAGATGPSEGSLRGVAKTEGAADPVPHVAQRLACLLACAGGSLDAASAQLVLDGSAVAAASISLLERGMASLSLNGALTLRPDLVPVCRVLLSSRERSAMARRAAEHAPSTITRAYFLAAAGDVPGAMSLWSTELSHLRAVGRLHDVVRVGRDALCSAPEQPEVELVALAVARALVLLGDYGAARETLRDRSSTAAVVLAAEAARRAGDLTAARTLLGLNRPRDAAAADWCAVSARVAFDGSDLETAERDAERATHGSAWAAARGAEVQTLVALRNGQQADAERAAQRCEASSASTGDGAEQARAGSLSAMVALATGDRSRAGLLAATAFDAAERSGDVHGAALCLLNLGLSRVDSGDLGAALSALRDAARRLLRLGRASDAARALYNLGNAYMLIGDDAGALHTLGLAKQAAHEGDVATAMAFAWLSEAEVIARRGVRAAAAEALESAVRVPNVPIDDGALVCARAASLYLALDDVGRATTLLADVRARAASSVMVRAECLLAEARLLLLRGSHDDAVEAMAGALAAAEQCGRFEVELRAKLLGALVFERAGRAQQAASLAAASRMLLEHASLGLTPRQRALLRAVESYRAVLTANVSGLPTSSAHIDERWRKLAMASGVVLAEPRTERVLSRVLDAALDLTGAERGFVVTVSGGALRLRATRGLTASSLEATATPSRTIVTRAMSEGRVVASTDALVDERLDGVASVYALSLRSVVAVPLHRGDRVIGALYLDDRLRPSAFGDGEVALLSQLAHVASIALDGLRRLRRERRTARRLELLRARLTHTVQAQAVELSSLRSTTPSVESYPTIVGRGAAMRTLLTMVDRVARSELPVLVTGESGTGKELFARAIADQGPRKAAPFVSENCSAIPETLLESALFGHVRGAFTGADRSRVGLFDAADGGTLFLDEIGEMSPAMQVRLLRVLQDGEIRPVGSERVHKVDVRVIAATHRDLQQLVRAGTFREDLYYRLAVVTLRVPPLRERTEDIAELVAHFARLHGGDTAPRIDRRALALLTQHPWPGNVRQLENELRRALMLADGVVRVEHLSLSQGDRVPDVNDALDLRAHTDALERRLIRAALDQTGGNQSLAAKLLGVSRFGLQKMLRRLEITPAATNRRSPSASER